MLTKGGKWFNPCGHVTRSQQVRRLNTDALVSLIAALLWNVLEWIQGVEAKFQYVFRNTTALWHRGAIPDSPRYCHTLNKQIGGGSINTGSGDTGIPKIFHFNFTLHHKGDGSNAGLFLLLLLPPTATTLWTYHLRSLSETISAVTVHFTNLPPPPALHPLHLATQKGPSMTEEKI